MEEPDDANALSREGTRAACKLHVPESNPAFESGTYPRLGRVLVVDDEPLIANALKLLLSDEHRVTSVTSGQDALQRLTLLGEEYDVILCDLMMPRVSGMEIHARLVEESPDSAARMIFITGGSNDPEVRAFIDRVPNLVLEKPLDMDALRALLKRRIRPPSEARIATSA